MKKILFLIAGFLLAYSSSYSGSGNNLYTIHHANWWNTKAEDNLTNVIMEITPRGLYADIELTFVMNGNNIYTGPNDSLQGILSFELPPNSYIHDSWLWLDANTIIKAELKERSQAIQIYSGYIHRKQDPSLLVKNGVNLYQLNVFPITNSYARKVKISFSTLMVQKGDKAVLTLPTNVLCGSQNRPPFMAIIHTDAEHATPAFVESNINNFIVSTVGSVSLLDVPAGAYGLDKEMNLVYSTTNTPSLTLFPTGTDEGVYQLKVPAETGAVAPRHLNFILDHHPDSYYSYAGSIYKFEEIKRQLRTFLLNSCLPTDSFNVFYVDNNAVVQAFPGWAAIDLTTVNNLFDNMPNSISSDQGKLQDLLIAGILFGQTKNAAEEQTIFISQNKDYVQLQSASQMFTYVQGNVGNFTNKVHVINYAYSGNSSSPGSQILFNNFCSATGGTYYKHTGYMLDGFIGKYTYDLDIKGILNGTLLYMSGGYNTYNVSLPLTGGFTHNSFNLSGSNKYFSWKPYCETGKYYGNVAAGNVIIDYVGQNGPVSYQAAVTPVIAGTDQYKRDWVNNYILDMEGANNSLLYSEILDSSFANNVLCYETAFLALEDGDTLNNDTIKVANPTNVESVKEQELSGVKCYPNPFGDRLTIESPDEIEQIEIFDITGKLVYSRKNIGSKTFVWNGTNNDDRALSEGIYIIKLRYKERVETVKVTKI